MRCGTLLLVMCVVTEKIFKEESVPLWVELVAIAVVLPLTIVRDYLALAIRVEQR